MHDDVPMWTYWSLQEGTPGVEPDFQMTDAGEMPPVIHVDTDAPLISDVDGSVISDELGRLLQTRCSFRRHSGRRDAICRGDAGRSGRCRPLWRRFTRLRCR